jgi:hypothetical protein
MRINQIIKYLAGDPRRSRGRPGTSPPTMPVVLHFNMPAKVGPVPQVGIARESGARASGRTCPRKWVVVSWLG